MHRHRCGCLPDTLPDIFMEACVRHRSVHRLAALLVVTFSITAARGEAQSTAHGSLVPIPYRSYVAVNPLGIPLDIASLEAESAIANGITIGGSASYTDFDHKRYTSFDAKMRYYPGEIVLQGFSMGAVFGLTKFRSDTATAGVNQEFTAPTLGVAVDYNFMLGGRGRFVIGTGVTGKRVLASAAKRALVDIGRAYPSARFVVGLAF